MCIFVDFCNIILRAVWFLCSCQALANVEIVWSYPGLALKMCDKGRRERVHLKTVTLQVLSDLQNVPQCLHCILWGSTAPLQRCLSVSCSRWGIRPWMTSLDPNKPINTKGLSRQILSTKNWTLERGTQLFTDYKMTVPERWLKKSIIEKFVELCPQF